MKKLMLLIWVVNWLAPAVVNAQCTIEQNSNSGNALTVEATREVGQTFVACGDGFLDSLEVMISNLNMASVDLELKIAKGSGTATGVLHTQTVTLSNSGMLTIPLSKSVVLSDGVLYTFSLVGIAGSSGDISFALGIGDVYRAGNMLVRNVPLTTADLQFKVFLGSPNQVPTMSQWGLLIFGLLILNCSVYLIEHRNLYTT